MEMAGVVGRFFSVTAGWSAGNPERDPHTETWLCYLRSFLTFPDCSGSRRCLIVSYLNGFVPPAKNWRKFIAQDQLFLSLESSDSARRSIEVPWPGLHPVTFHSHVNTGQTFPRSKKEGIEISPVVSPPDNSVHVV
jgi:hypothetical protein